MVVVAIVGVLGALSAGFTVQMLKSSRVNTAAKTVNAAIGLARQRSITAGCAHFAQLNGPTYTGAGPQGFPRTPGTVAIVRKADCDSTNAFFEAGDRIVESEQWSPDDPFLRAQVEVRPPPGLVGGAHMANDAITFGFDRLGRRSIFVDMTGGGMGNFVVNNVFDATDVLVVFEESVPPGNNPQLGVTMRVRPASSPRVN
jgi:hypothetical protein